MDHWKNEGWNYENNWRHMKMKTQQLKVNGCSKRNSKRDVHSDTSLSKEIRKTSSKVSKLIPKLETEEQAKHKVSRRKDQWRNKWSRDEENNKKINEIKSWCFENINESDKPLTRFIKKKAKRTQINKIRNEKGEVTMDITEM